MKAISINKWLVAGIVGALAYLCIHPKKRLTGIGVVKASADYKRDFATRYFKDNFYTLRKVMPVEDFIELWINGKAIAMSNGKIKLNGKKYTAPATNDMIRNLDSSLAVEYYGIEFETPHVVKQSMINPQHPDLYYYGMNVTKRPSINWDFE